MVSIVLYGAISDLYSPLNDFQCLPISGLNTSTIPIYVSETSKSHRRGRMVAIQLSIVIFGIVVAYWLDYGCIRTLEGEVSSKRCWTRI